MIFHIYGTDIHLCREKLRELETGFVAKKDKGGLNVVRIFADGLDYDRFTQEALTVPFLSDKKLIVVSGIMSEMTAGRKKLRDQIAEFVKTREASIENNLLFFDVFEDAKKIPQKDALFNHLKGQKYSWKCNPPKGRDLPAWINKYCQTEKIKIEGPAITELINLTGGDLTQITLELAKLKAYKNGESITSADIKNLVKAKFDDDVFKLTDALANKNRQLALKLISDQLLSGNQPLALLASISWQFKTLLKLKAELEENPRTTAASLATKIGVHPYVAQKNMASAKNFSLKQLININNQLIEIEKQLKSGAKNPELLFDLLVAKNS